MIGRSMPRSSGSFIVRYGVSDRRRARRLRKMNCGSLRSMCVTRPWCKRSRLVVIAFVVHVFSSSMNGEVAAMPAGCTHLNFVKTDAPNTEGCEECLAAGDTWVHLRLCRACGHVGCCDNSKNRHATKHFKKTGHPIITSLEPGEGW